VELSDEFDRALAFASNRHRRHLRKGTAVPYLAHLLGVTSIVLEHGGTEREAIGALLHDTLEDGKATIVEVREQFGDEVADIVAGLSDTDQADNKPDWWTRKRAYVKHLPHASASVRLISAADKLHNARAIVKDQREIGDVVFDRFTADKAATLWYYRALISAFRASGTAPRLVDELNRVVTELEHLAYPVNLEL